MKITVNKNYFEKALARVAGAIGRQKNMPILAHIRLQANRAGFVNLTATDLEMVATTQCDAEVEIEGAIAVPADKLIAAVAGSGETVSLELQDGLRLDVESDIAARYEIACLDADEFPSQPTDLFDDDRYTVTRGVFPSIVKAVEHAVCRSPQKYNLCGIHLQQEQGQLVAAAIDGHRLSVASIAIHNLAQDPATMPLKAATILAGMGSTVDVGWADNCLTFSSGATSLAARLIDGDFPDFRKVIPEYLDKAITVNRAALIDALGKVGCMVEGDTKAVNLLGDDDGLSVTALGLLGKATAAVPIMGDSGLQLSVNSRYLLQALKALDGEDVFIKFKDHLGPLMLIPVDHGIWDERLEIIMPCRS